MRALHWFRYFLGVTALLGTLVSRPCAAPITDPTLLTHIALSLDFEEGRLSKGKVELLKHPGRSGDFIVLLDGTEVGRLEASRAEALLEDYPTVRSQVKAGRAGRSSAGTGAEGSPSWFAAQKGMASWARMGRWEEKATLSYDLDYLYSGVLVRRNRIAAGFVKKVGPVYLGAEVNHLGFKGELPDSVPYAAKAGRLGGGLRIGFDYARYHVQYAPYALPEYFWTESDLQSKYFARNGATPGDPTQVVKIFETRSPPSMAHSLETRLGAFRYTLTMAPDIYHSPIHYAALDDLPGVFGTWGMGMVVTPEGYIPGGWYRFAPIRLAAMSLGGRPLHLAPGRISYFRSDRSLFRIAWSGELAFGLMSK